MVKDKDTHLNILRTLLKPLARFSLRNSRYFGDFIGAAKEAFIEVAVEELERTGKVNVNRIATATGLHRDEVTRIHKRREPAREEPAGVLWRVLGQWEQQRRFRSKSGKPLVLSYLGENSEFQQLTESVSKHLNYRTILKELERISAVELTARGAKLIRGHGTVQPDAERSMQLVADDIDSLLRSSEENIRITSMGTGNHHLSTEYDNISSIDISNVRSWLLNEGKDFHKRARDFLSKLDRDINPVDSNSPDEIRMKVRLSSFSYIAPFSPRRRTDNLKE